MEWVAPIFLAAKKFAGSFLGTSKNLKQDKSDISREAHPKSDAEDAPPEATTSDRRRVLAKKRLDNFSLMFAFRCALTSLTDTLAEVGVRVSWLESAKGTLHVSGDKTIDCSPLKQRTPRPTKRKDFENGDEPYADFLEELNRSYDSQEDEDYNPPSDEDTTDSEEYRVGSTESESDLGCEVDKEELRPRNSKKSTRTSSAANPTATTAEGKTSSAPDAKTSNPDNDRSQGANQKQFSKETKSSTRDSQVTGIPVPKNAKVDSTKDGKQSPADSIKSTLLSFKFSKSPKKITTSQPLDADPTSATRSLLDSSDQTPPNGSGHSKASLVIRGSPKRSGQSSSKQTKDTKPSSKDHSAAEDGFVHIDSKKSSVSTVDSGQGNAASKIEQGKLAMEKAK